MIDFILDEIGINKVEYDNNKSKIISTGEMILFLGQSLSEKIDQPNVTCQGIIRLSIKDHYTRSPKYLRVDQWISLMSTNLISRLSKIRVNDAELITNKVIKDFLNYQFIVTQIENDDEN